MTGLMTRGLPARFIPGYASVEYTLRKRRNEGRLRKGRRLHRVSAYYSGRHRMLEAEECACLAVDTLAGAEPSAERDALLAEALTGLGRVARIRGRYDEAESALQHALTLLAPWGDGGSVRISALAGLGIVCKDTGRFTEAEQMYQQLEQELLHAGNSAGPAMADLHHNRAGLAHVQGHFRTGEILAREAVAIRIRLLGDAHPLVAADESVLAANLAGQGRLAEAEALYRRILACFARQSPPDEYEIAVNVHGLAGVLAAHGRYAEAERLYRRALAVKENLVGPENAEVALVLNNLAVLLHSQGRTDEAEFCYQRCSSILDATLGPDHPTADLARRNRERSLAPVPSGG